MSIVLLRPVHRTTSAAVASVVHSANARTDRPPAPAPRLARKAPRSLVSSFFSSVIPGLAALPRLSPSVPSQHSGQYNCGGSMPSWFSGCPAGRICSGGVCCPQRQCPDGSTASTNPASCQEGAAFSGQSPVLTKFCSQDKCRMFRGSDKQSSLIRMSQWTVHSCIVYFAPLHMWS